MLVKIILDRSKPEEDTTKDSLMITNDQGLVSITKMRRALADKEGLQAADND